MAGQIVGKMFDQPIQKNFCLRFVLSGIFSGGKCCNLTSSCNATLQAMLGMLSNSVDTSALSTRQVVETMWERFLLFRSPEHFSTWWKTNQTLLASSSQVQNYHNPTTLTSKCCNRYNDTILFRRDFSPPFFQASLATLMTQRNSSAPMAGLFCRQS